MRNKNIEEGKKPKLIEDLGKRKFTENSQGYRFGRFGCPYCENTFECRISSVNSGDTRSCGCLKGKASISHVLKLNRFYGTWSKMVHRCTNPKNKKYKDYCNEKGLDVIEQQGYVILADEEVNAITKFDKYSYDDLDYLLLKKDIKISEVDGMLSWVGVDLGQRNKYRHFADMCDNKMIYSAKRDKAMMVTQLPIRLFTCAKRVIIMTYMFDGNILDCFLRLKGIKVKKFTEVKPTPISKKDIRSLITLLPLDDKVSKLNQTNTGYGKMTQAQLDEIGKYITRVARRYDIDSKDVLFTLPKNIFEPSKKSHKRIRPKGYSFYKEYVQPHKKEPG